MPVNCDSNSNGCTWPFIVTEIVFADMSMWTFPLIWFEAVENPPRSIA
jgi:hypothetical protein